MATASDFLFQPHAVSTTEVDEPAQPGDAVDFPCSVAQERFWLLDRLEPGNPSYNVAVRWQLLGTINVELLERSWCEIVARHEVLRTRFLEVDGKPVQRVAPASAFKLNVTDLTSLPPAERAEEGNRIGLIEARAPFDLAGGPLLRVVLLRYTANEAIILVTSHQIVADGWSIGVMAREMGRIYQALAVGVPPELDPLPIQYGDYARWQLEWLRQRGTAAEAAYWSRQLAGVAPFEVIADRPRAPVPTTNGAIASLVLPRELTDGLRELTAESGVTMFAAAVATLSAVLARYTGKTEIVVGTQVSDRDQVELEPMIGQFVNSLILRLRVDGDPRFTQLLARTSATVSEALEQRNIPIERLLGMVKAGRGGSNSPAVSINFIFQRSFIEDQDYGDFQIVDLPSLPAGAIYDLNFFMVERPVGWRFSCQYNTDQFEGATVERLLGYVRSALESAVSGPSRRISELRLADPAERLGLRPKLEGPAHNDAQTSTVGELISAQVHATPNAIALGSAGRTLTYAELEAQSHRAALLLSARGARAGARVALLIPRSADLVIAILALWKLGAAPVVLDVNDPPEHVRKQTEASGATVTITARDLTAEAAASDAGLPSQAPSPVAAVWLGPGEAGGLVAVEISHSSLFNEINSLRQRLSVEASDVFVSSGRVVAQRLGIELFLPLIQGGRATFDLDQTRATAVVTTKENCSLWLEEPADGWKIPRIVIERDAFGPRTVARLLARSRELWAFESFAATSGIVALRQILDPHDTRFLGTPLDDTRVCVLDANLAPTPIDAFGELYVGGHLGTVADPEAGHFIFASTGTGGDERLFRTGVAARIRADGVVEVCDRHPGIEVQPADAPAPEQSDEIDPQLERRLRSIWAQLLDVSESSIDADANFFELGGHSLLAARMLTRVETEFGRRVTLTALFREPSIRGLARLLASEVRDFDFRQMVKLQENGANIPLIAVNNTGVYYLLAKRLGSQQPVTSLQVFDPSATHDNLPQSLEQIAAEYVKLIRRAHPTGPYVLAGWCVAGALAFEIARQLSAGGARVSRVFLIDSWAPGYFGRLPLVRRVLGSYSLRWQLTLADWGRYSSGEQTFAEFVAQRATVRNIRSVWQKLFGHKRHTKTRAAFNTPELHDKWLLEFLKATTNRYEPRNYDGTVTLFRSTREPTGWLFDPLAGWGQFAQQGVELVMVEGNHFTMFQDPGVNQMAQRMAALIGPA